MKTLIGTLLALGVLSTAASAQYCPPGYGYGPRYGYNRTVEAAPAPVAQAPAVEQQAAPIEPPALPAQPAQPAPEAPPK